MQLTARLVVRSLTVAATLALAASAGSRAAAATNYTVVGWNNLGMHCLDADFSVFSILPPYNTINAHLIDPGGNLVTNPAGITVTYEAVADPAGSINTTARDKTDFWDYVAPLFGLSLPVDVGLPVPGPGSYAMPGTNNVPQALGFEAAAAWFVAYGIPITPYDDAFEKNPYPLMRLVARANGTVLATTDIVLPVSDEMDCRTCHASGSGPAAAPAAGWVNLPDVQRDFRLNILRLHDQLQAGQSLYTNALQAAGYSPAGLEANVVNDGKPILCAACHLSEALPGSGQAGISALTAAMHGGHAAVIDPINGLVLDAAANRAACYRCHPGSETKCLRGVMGRAVAAEGSLAIQCQSCHGSMSLVGDPGRVGWLQEPNCQCCHSGDAVSNSGAIRFTSAFDAPGHLRAPANQRFATEPDTPATGISLYRFSRGHGGLACSACHGSTHAEYPAAHANDNIQSVQLQGHVGTLVECDACHGNQPSTTAGGPHGMHPLGATWVDRHPDLVEHTGAAQCRVCHGMDYRGTVLSRAHADRTINSYGTKQFWRGFQVGCYTCHNGPGSDDVNNNRAPAVADAAVTTPTNTPVAVPLQAGDADHDALTLRIVSQPEHGTVALAGSAATYYPDTGYVGGDAFTFAANDTETDSNLGHVLVNVGTGGCAYSIDPLAAAVDAFGGSGSVAVSAASGCGWTVTAQAAWLTVTAGASGTGNGTVKYAVAANPGASARMGDIIIAGHTFTVHQAGSSLDLSAAWVALTQTCKTSSKGLRCKLSGLLDVQSNSSLKLPKVPAAIHLSADPLLDAGDPLLRTYTVKPAAPGQPKPKKIKVKLPAGQSATGLYLIAVVDGAGAVPDVDQANNVAVFGPVP